MFYTAARTVYGLELELSYMFNKPYEAQVNTTLNEKFNIATKEPLPKGKPFLQYFCLGVGGNAALPDADAYPYSPHSPIDAALFEHIPFVIRPVGNDLTLDERSSYRMRVETEIQGNRYYCYYLKRLRESDIQYKPGFYRISSRNGTETIDPINTNELNTLNPVPISKVNKIIGSSSSYIIKKGKVIISLTYEELVEIKKNIDLMFPSLEPKTITEIGLCTGIDKPMDRGYEALQAQIAFHIGPSIDLTMELNNKSDLYKTFELGGLEPFYAQ